MCGVQGSLHVFKIMPQCSIETASRVISIPFPLLLDKAARVSIFMTLVRPQQTATISNTSPRDLMRISGGFGMCEWEAVRKLYKYLDPLPGDLGLRVLLQPFNQSPIFLQRF